MKQASHRRTDTAPFHLYEVPKIIRLIEAEGNGDCQELVKREMGRCYSKFIRFQVCKMNKF